jgi:hypothetical protein
VGLLKGFKGDRLLFRYDCAGHSDGAATKTSLSPFPAPVREFNSNGKTEELKQLDVVSRPQQRPILKRLERFERLERLEPFVAHLTGLPRWPCDI